MRDSGTSTRLRFVLALGAEHRAASIYEVHTATSQAGHSLKCVIVRGWVICKPSLHIPASVRTSIDEGFHSQIRRPAFEDSENGRHSLASARRTSALT